MLTILIISFSFPINGSAFSSQDVGRGAFGDDVIELQARLQYLSYYHGAIDGKFGYGTYWALRNFQEQYGLPVDGVAGKATKEKLANNSDFDRTYVHKQINAGNRFTYYGGIPLDQQVKQGGGSNSTTSMQLPANYSEQDLQFLANAVYGESRGEPYEGQVAVAAVILNRLESPEFPDSIQIKVAKDNAEVLGLNAMEYIQEEVIDKQAEIPIRWETFFAENATVEEVKKIYTANHTLDLRKCYEALVRLDKRLNDTFRIVIDTETHEVLKVEKLH